MNDRDNNIASDDVQSTPEAQVDQGRRRLGAAGAAGTAVLLSVASRSAVAGWGTCTGSELASGNLSRSSTANPCGCSPGFWGPQNQNGTYLWDHTPKLSTTYPRTNTFKSTFGLSYFKDQGNVKGDKITLDQVFPGQIAGPGSQYPNNYNGGDSAAMHAVAALLNATFYGLRFPAGFADGPAVILAFKNACIGGTVSAFVTKVDVYNSSNTWCNGKDHGGLP